MHDSNIFKYTVLSIILISSLAWAQVSQNVQFVANVNMYPSIGYNDCWGYVAPDGREYALLGVENGTSIIDITDPQNIQEVSFIGSASSLWKDIKTYQHYGYVVNETGGGLQIIDLSDLPNSASLAATYTGFQTSHNIFIDTTNGMLYAEGNSSEPVRVLSLDNPTVPVQISYFGIECHDVFVRDTLAFISEGYSGSFGIYSVSDPYAPVLVQRIVVPSAGYCHNAWSNEDNTLLMTTEETQGKTMKVWDISDLSNISMTDEILAPDGLAHNTHIKNGYAYVSHYGDGLRIIDISDPQNIFEAGYYDTFPGTGGGYVGAWGAFPFFDSGKVLISDMSTGLYVVTFSGAVVSLPGNNPVKTIDSYMLHQNYPNPFNPSTTIRFSLPQISIVKLVVYSQTGQRIRTLRNEILEGGEHSVCWDGRNDSGAPVAAGIYFYRLEADQFQQTNKMILLK